MDSSDILAPKIHAVIISWEGFGPAARSIAEHVAPYVENLSVIYSNRAEMPETGPGDWISVHNSAFFGAKFRAALDVYEGGIFLLFHADTSFSDWPALVDRCRSVFRNHPNLGIWSPDFTHTPFPNSSVRISDGPEPELVSVGFPDGIVVALCEDVVRRLQELDYSKNNLGWGIIWAGVAYSFTHNLLVCRETSLVVEHAMSTGYDSQEATRQSELFLSQLTIQERNQVELIRALTNSRIGPVPPLHIRIARRLRRQFKWQQRSASSGSRR
jgi:hypothetical protein